MELGIDSFAAVGSLEGTTYQQASKDTINNLLEKIVLADQVGLDIFGIGEHHRQDFADSAPTILLAAAAAKTKNIRLTSAVTVLSAADPVRVFEDFSTLDIISDGRAEMVVGRGSFVDAFPLFGYNLDNYDEVFDDKLDLMLNIRDNKIINWKGKFRPSLYKAEIYPRPIQDPFPIWLGVGGTPNSFIKAGKLGLPLMLAVIGGETRQFKPLVDLYRKAGEEAGHPEKLKLGLHSLGYLANDTQQAKDEMYPGYADMFTAIGKERGYGPVRRSDFEAQSAANGAFLVGSPEDVAEKILRHSQALGGVERVTFQMDMAKLPQDKMLHSIELLASVKEHLAKAL